MKTICLVLFTVAALLSCSKEEWFDNRQEEINFFAVPEEATGEEAELRRSFFNETGVYLLFNDTLGVREVPTLSGTTSADLQVIDFFWTMNPGDYYADSLEFFYYRDLAVKEAAARFLQDEVLADLPELFYPYSILLLDRCVRYANTYGTYGEGEDISTFSGFQCTAIALGDVGSLTGEEQASLETDVIGQIVIAGIGLIPDEEFTTFYSYSEEYYGDYTWNVPTPVQSVGFLDTYESSSFEQDEDKQAFVEKVFELSESEFRETYSEYPLIISKMEVMVDILRKYGINVYE